MGNLKGYFGSAKGYFGNVKGYFRNVECYFRNVKYYFRNVKYLETEAEIEQPEARHSRKRYGIPVSRCKALFRIESLIANYYPRGKRKNYSKSPHAIYGLYGKRAYGTDGISGSENAGCQPHQVEGIVEQAGCICRQRHHNAVQLPAEAGYESPDQP
ncbi:MAG: hypothetical protein ACLUSK_11305 [Bacteroides stercoris]